jgi:hypothetical protein
MSAWYVFSALGFYPVTPGSTQYVIGTPLFPHASVTLADGVQIVIDAPQVSAENRYVQAVRVNGQARAQALLEHAELRAGAHVEFEMGPLPNPRWGAIEPGQPLAAGEHAQLPTPILAPTEQSFAGAIEVTAQGPAGARLHYTIDGSAPGPTSPQWPGALRIEDSATVQVVALAGDRRSGVARASYHERLHDWPVQLTHAYNRQYHAGGPAGLVDGIRGTENWRLGGWQGYQPSDFEAIVDLHEITRIRKISSGYLQDARSWIWLPVRVEYAVSENGRDFVEVGSLTHGVSDTDLEHVVVHEFEQTLNRRARYVRVRAINYGTIPAWHPGAGNPAFIFVDEIQIE